ncbi:MAG: DUF4234 domain-containing protein [Labilithrix sp.]|nr:DUF4234 domain-containing protein [Labilithrix sp.]
MDESDDERNPYAPPAAERDEVGDDGRARGGPSDFEPERRSVGLCVLLGVVTFGIYNAIWLLRRQPFLDRLPTPHKLGAVFPIVIIALNLISVPMALIGGGAEGVSRVLSIGGGIAAIVANFRVAAILRAELRRTGRYIDISTIWVFLLRVYYLQYKINQAADTPPLALRKKKKRKKKAKNPPAADASSRDAIAGDAGTG